MADDELDEYSLARELTGARIPFIFISAFADQGAHAKALRLGAITFLTKPRLPAGGAVRGSRCSAACERLESLESICNQLATSIVATGTAGF